MYGTIASVKVVVVTFKCFVRQGVVLRMYGTIASVKKVPPHINK